MDDSNIVDVTDDIKNRVVFSDTLCAFGYIGEKVVYAVSSEITRDGYYCIRIIDVKEKLNKDTEYVDIPFYDYLLYTLDEIKNEYEYLYNSIMGIQ